MIIILKIIFTQILFTWKNSNQSDELEEWICANFALALEKHLIVTLRDLVIRGHTAGWELSFSENSIQAPDRLRD